MLSTDKSIEIYTWKDSKLNQDNPKVILRQMLPAKIGNKLYNPENNARQIARLFSMSLPGNTVDIIYNHIAKELMYIADPNLDYVDMNHISNLIRIAINELAEGN